MASVHDASTVRIPGELMMPKKVGNCFGEQALASLCDERGANEEWMGRNAIPHKKQTHRHACEKHTLVVVDLCLNSMSYGTSWYGVSYDTSLLLIFQNASNLVVLTLPYSYSMVLLRNESYEVGIIHPSISLVSSVVLG